MFEDGTIWSYRDIIDQQVAKYERQTTNLVYGSRRHVL